MIERFTSCGLLLNDIIEINQGIITENGRNKMGIRLQRDLNNVEVNNLKIEDVISIIVSSKNRFKQSGIMELI